MHVEHFMTPNPVACDENDTVEHAARLMDAKGVGFVVALRNGKVAGVLTDRQLATKVLGHGLPGKTKVSQVMTRDPATVTLDDTMFSVVDTLRSAGVVRRVPVVNERNELLGVVSVSDLAVIARDLIDAVLLEDTRHALKEVKALTGGKQVRKEMKSPTRPRTQGPEIRPVTEPTKLGRAPEP